jgi:hypothetical protein
VPQTGEVDFIERREALNVYSSSIPKFQAAEANARIPLLRYGDLQCVRYKHLAPTEQTSR